ncbi:probable 6-phosphogluconolactonase 1 [Dioscorea cayenensis subsp. rotundata]|uniref:Probable 6-phosphogluconolactonase n=1 Tax=Dioscorea cayennensis subsp. rotundata TaxID=55577 RepID=A0AB40BYT2_DIOCR|nr:probable 6-phosphogluconolactonase 1 [Dioscorea cayenensis subsp. rotundata]XP_039131374.1 probable 6-phosphogluconolactonase 1 [Dioscorea cayenensis subsp. rotundata]XP_039131375.1 probable 6-phosphogluconolactonase 1 [Dioscorea cayenensis subsp. rotundata]
MAAVYDLKQRGQLTIFDSFDDLATDLAEYIAQLSEISVKERGCFTVALSGGSLISFLGKLYEAPYDKTVDWTKWYVLWADERAVSKSHPDSNYKLTKDNFLSKVPILNNHVYSINDNLTVEDAAMQYEFVIRQLVKARILNVSSINDCPKFDLILLSVGSNGSIASLFPHHPALEQSDDWITYITDASEPPPERITFTLPVINSASNVVVLATGEDKATAMHFAVDDSGEEFDASAVPACLVRPVDGKLVWFMDMLAASKLQLSG